MRQGAPGAEGGVCGSSGSSVLGLLLLLVFMGGWSGCARPDASSEDDAEAWNPVPVEVVSVRRGEVARVLRASTTLSGVRETLVQAETAGVVTELLVDQGDRVASGERLLVLSDQESRLALEEAQRTVNRLTEERRSTAALVSEGLLGRQLLDELDARLDQARSQVDRLRSRRASLVVRAPFDGVITERRVGPAETVAPNQVLFRLVDDASLEAIVQVPERELQRIRPGMDAEVAVDALGGRVQPATVRSIDPFVDPRSGTLRVRVRLTADEATDDEPRVLPGMFVQVRLPLDVRSNTLVIPRRAVVREGERVVVYVLREPRTRPSGQSTGPESAWTVERIEPELGHEEGALVEVREGLEEGDRVLEVGQVGLDPAAVVHVVVDASEEASTPPVEATSGEPDPARSAEAQPDESEG